MVGEDQHAVHARDQRGRQRLAVEHVAADLHLGDIRIVVQHVEPLPAQQLDHAQRGRAARVIDVPLERDAQHQHPPGRAPIAVPVALQQRQQAPDHVVGHVLVDPRRQLDEVHVEVVLARFPRQVIGVDGDAVAAHQAGGKRHEAVGFGGRRGHHLPHVQAHALAQLPHLIDQGDIDVAERVFQQFGHLGHRRRRHRHHPRRDARQQPGRQPGAGGVAAPHDHRHLPHGVARVARIDPFGRKCQKDVAAHAQPGGLEGRAHDLVGGAGITGAAQHHQQTRAGVCGNRGRGRAHRREIWLLLRRERRGDADDHRVRTGQHRGISRGRKPAGCQGRGHGLRGEVANV